MEYPEDKITFCKFIGGPSEHQIAYFAKALASAEIDKAAELLKIELQKSIKAFIEEQFPNDDTIHEISGFICLFFSSWFPLLNFKFSVHNHFAKNFTHRNSLPFFGKFRFLALDSRISEII